MSHRPFLLERYFAIHEFNAKYIACASDGESLSVPEILAMNDQSTVDILWNNMKLGYTESEGNALLRQEIANMYNTEYSNNNSNNQINKDNILIITPQEGIYIAMMTLLKNNDSVIVVSPSYQSLYENALSSSLNINVIYWKFKLNPDTNNWYLDINELENKLISPYSPPKMLIINFPHNPTGYIPSYNNYIRILNIVQKYNIILFSDEMYWFTFNNKINKLYPAIMTTNNNNIISLNGMSKTFCMPGVRIGWLITKNVEFMNKFQQFKDYITICSSAPSENLSILALRNGNYLKIIKRVNNIINKNRNILYKFVQNNDDVFYWTQYIKYGNSGGLAKFIGYKLINILSVQQFCDYIVKNCNVMLIPSNMFEYDDVDNTDNNINKEFIRFGLGRKNLKEALTVLNDYLVIWRKNNFKIDNKSKL